MVHKAFEVIGKRVFLMTPEWNKLGMFQENFDWDTRVEGEPRHALDFITLIYEPNTSLLNLMSVRFPLIKEIQKKGYRSHPVLDIHVRIDHTQLNYHGFRQGNHFFDTKNPLNYMRGGFFCSLWGPGDEDFERYVNSFKKAGFKVR